MPRPDDGSQRGRRATGQAKAVTAGVLTLLVAGGVLRLLSRTTGGGWLALGSAALLVLPVVAWLTTPDLRSLDVDWHAPARATCGAEVTFTLRVRNSGSRTAVPVRVGVVLSGFDGMTVAVPSLRPGGSVTVPLTRVARSRGEHVGPTIILSSSSPIGLVRAQRRLDVEHLLLVHPAPVRPPAVDPGERADGDALVRLARPLAGRGTEVLGLREWRLGEGTRAISARATARHGRPLVLERERDVSPSRVLLLGGGEGEGWEQQVAALAALAVRDVAQGRQVVLLGLPPVPGRRTPHSVLDAFARADQVPTLSAAAVRQALRATPAGGVLVIAPGLVGLDVHWAGLRAEAAACRVRLVLLGA